MSKVLIIEEEERIRKSLVSIFKQEGFEICDGIKWEKAGELLKKNTYDLIVVDLDTETCDGSEMVKSIKFSNSTAEVIAIIPQDRYDADRIASYKIYDCILKPFRRKDIVDMGKKALEKKQLADKVRNLEQIIDTDELTFM